MMDIKPTRSDSDYDAALEEIEGLFASEAGMEEADRLEVLLVLAQDYQERHFPAGPPDMQSAIMYELDKRGFTREAMTTREGAETHRRQHPPRRAGCGYQRRQCENGAEKGGCSTV